MSKDVQCTILVDRAALFQEVFGTSKLRFNHHRCRCPCVFSDDMDGEMSDAT